MDPLSQAVLGASWAQAAAARRRKRLGDAGLGAAGFAGAGFVAQKRMPHLRDIGIVGALSGMAPDLDALIQSPSDPLLFLEYHRHFTHSLAFVPFGALLCAAALHGFMRRRLSFRETYLYCLLGFGSHGLLDACTTYGTQLLWPFCDARIAWSIVAAIDPSFTVPVLVLVLLAALRNRVRYAFYAAAWAFAYLGFAALQHERAESAAAALAAERGHRPARLEALPGLFSVLLYKTIYEHDGRYYVDAIRTGMRTTVIAGESTPRLVVARDFPWLRPGTQQAIDVDRFQRVAHGFVTAAPGNRITDLRYSMLPNEIAPFWGIELDPAAAPDAHVEFVTTRDHTVEQLRRLLGLMF